MNDFAQICILGLGYVGLPTALIFANKGIKVLGVDVNPKVINTLKAGKPPIIEPELETLLAKVTQTGNFSVSLKPQASKIFIISVPTPCGSQHEPDLTFLQTAAASIAPLLEAENLIIIESTIPIGITEKITTQLASARPDLIFPLGNHKSPQIYVAHSPERVLPGRIIYEIANNDRVVGGMTPECAMQAAKLYRVITSGALHQTNAKTAELVKLAENSFRDINIAFANEIDSVAKNLEINIWEIISLANRHPRVNILSPGPGVGGHCIPVDPWFLVHSSPINTPLVQTARAVNDSMPEKIANRIVELLPFPDATICCLGLAYKANIGDMRESPAIFVVQSLLERVEGKILVVEPFISSLPLELASDKRVKLVEIKDAVKQASVIALLTDHTDFIDFKKEIPEEKIKIDTRGVWGLSI